MGKDKFKIIYIHQDALITGSAISLGNMIRSIDFSIYTCSVIAPSTGPAINIWKDAGADVHVFPFHTFWTSPGPSCLSRGNIKQLRALLPNVRLKQFILSLKPNLVHINDKAALQAGISLKNTGIPIIQHSRSAYHLTVCKFNRLLSQIIIRNYAKHIICISEDELQGFGHLDNMDILNNTVNPKDAYFAIKKRQNTRKQLGITDNDIVIGMAENMSLNKGLKDIISIIKVLQPIDCVKFLLVGKLKNNDSLKSIGISQSSEEYLNSFVFDNQLSSKVLLTGHKDNPLDYIAAMDVLVVSKAHGVLGRQPIEAQAVGTAVVAINGHSGKSTIVKDGEGGFLVNTLPELISKLRSILSDRALLKQLSENGFIKAQRDFYPNNYISKLHRIYQKHLL